MKLPNLCGSAFPGASTSQHVSSRHADGLVVNASAKAATQSGGHAYEATGPGVAQRHLHGVAANFGARHGTPIVNAHSVMGDLYQALGHNRPPAIIGIFVEPYNNIVHTDAAGVGLNPFGHAAIAYTRQGSTQTMNISGSSTTPMVNFMPLEDYLFGVDNFDTGNEQGGIYNRTFRLMCVWDWPDKNIEAMHTFYTDLNASHQRRRARFSQLFSRVFNMWPGKKRWGNCAMWTSQGLVEAGMIDRNTMWPKQMVVQMMERIDADNPANVSCVWLPRVPHAKLTFGRGAGQRGMVAPCRAYRNCVYWDLGRQARATVTVPSNSMVARPLVLQR